MRNYTLLPSAPPVRDPASIASVLRWVCAQDQARLDQHGLDVACDPARALGVTRDELTMAMRGTV